MPGRRLPILVGDRDVRFVDLPFASNTLLRYHRLHFDRNAQLRRLWCRYQAAQALFLRQRIVYYWNDPLDLPASPRSFVGIRSWWPVHKPGHIMLSSPKAFLVQAWTFLDSQIHHAIGELGRRFLAFHLRQTQASFVYASAQKAG